MEDLLHIAPEFGWSVEDPARNEVVYCTSSVGFNSPVLFHHFLQLAIRSSLRVFTKVT